LTLSGDREAFGRLYDWYAHLVRAVALGASRDPSTVQDLTQECFLRAFRSLASLRDPDRFGPWVVGIAKQLVREQRRKRRPRSLDAATLSVADESMRPVDESDEIEHAL